jgi:hypothetical protein
MSAAMHIVMTFLALWFPLSAILTRSRARHAPAGWAIRHQRNAVRWEALGTAVAAILFVVAISGAA